MIVAICIRQIVFGSALILKVAKLDEKPRNIPNASLNCHVARRFPSCLLAIIVQEVFCQEVRTSEMIRGLKNGNLGVSLLVSLEGQFYC